MERYGVQMRENADQNNPKYEHFSRSEIFLLNTPKTETFYIAR